MSTYKMGFFNDMGHLSFVSNLPKEIEIKVYKKIYNDYIDMATDLKYNRVRFSILKPEVESNFIYTVDNYIVDVTLDLPEFNPVTMKSINLNYSKRLLNLL
jgi:hypothetical protein